MTVRWWLGVDKPEIVIPKAIPIKIVVHDLTHRRIDFTGATDRLMEFENA